MEKTVSSDLPQLRWITISPTSRYPIIYFDKSTADELLVGAERAQDLSERNRQVYYCQLGTIIVHSVLLDKYTMYRSQTEYKEIWQFNALSGKLFSKEHDFPDIHRADLAGMFLVEEWAGLDHASCSAKLEALLGLDPARLTYTKQSLQYLNQYIMFKAFDWRFREEAFQYLTYYIGETYLATHEGKWVMWTDVISGMQIPDIEHHTEPCFLFDNINRLLTPDENLWPNIHTVYHSI